MATFPHLPDNLKYSQLEAEVLEFWKREKIFERSIESRPEDKRWTFFEGPPTVNGTPGIHHLFSRALKDTFCRYKAMRGYRVHRKAGWDTHGLPVEIALEKQLGLREKSEIETKVGVEKFNTMARELVYHHIDLPHGWKEFTERIGYWVNMDDPYITCTNEYIESVWWALDTLFDKGLIYKGFKIVPQCPHCETPLSSHELSLGYQDVRDPSLFVKVKVAAEQPGNSLNLPSDTRLLVWTTTPWTLISNVALAVGEDIDYELARDPESGQHYIFARALREKLDRDGAWEHVAAMKGSELEKLRYERLFDFVSVDRDAFYVTLGNFVSTEDGTGIVHLAPAFGQDDYELSKVYDLPIIQPVTGGGRFTDQVTPWAGRPVKTIEFQDRTEEGVDTEIIIAMKERDLVLRSSRDYLHSYPHCWRCDNPLIYYARDSWYIRTTDYSAQMIERNGQIQWAPPEIGTGRFGNWLEENKDWSLSRDRYWGTPLPIWVNVEDPADIFSVGSIEELMDGVYESGDGTTVPVRDIADRIDLHKPFIDRVIFRRDGKTYRRTPELIDVWFDSGSMPFAQWHYPFENKDRFEANFPADFIAEGIDQTRGWFYTLHAIAVPLFGSAATRAIMVNDMVLDEHGQKMSKRKGNILDPFAIVEEHGADAARWYMITNAPPWRPMSFSETDLVKTVKNDFFRALVNTYSGFFALYANVDGYTGAEEEVRVDERPELDRWVLSALNSMITEYTRHMDGFDPTRAMRLVRDFTVDQLSNWYVRRNRRRFWKGEMSRDKIAAYQTLEHCLMSVVKLMAPVAPFLSDHIYRALNTTTGREEHASVHLALTPDADSGLIDRDLERRMARAQTVIALARSLREQTKIKVRQPLRRILLPVSTDAERTDYELVAGIIKEELNVKDVEFVDASGSSDVVRRKAKANFKVIGPKFGRQVKAVAAAIAGLDDTQIAQLQADGSLTVTAGSDNFDLLAEDVEILYEDIEGWLVASEATVTVALDTELDQDLIDEGLTREFVNRVQTLRKESGLEVTDRIHLSYSADEQVAEALERHREYIMRETLAVEFSTDGSSAMTQVDINGRPCGISLRRSTVEMA